MSVASWESARQESNTRNRIISRSQPHVEGWRRRGPQRWRQKQCANVRVALSKLDKYLRRRRLRRRSSSAHFNNNNRMSAQTFFSIIFLLLLGSDHFPGLLNNPMDTEISQSLFSGAIRNDAYTETFRVNYRTNSFQDYVACHKSVRIRAPTIGHGGAPIPHPRISEIQIAWDMGRYILKNPIKKHHKNALPPKCHESIY